MLTLPGSGTISQLPDFFVRIVLRQIQRLTILLGSLLIKLLCSLKLFSQNPKVNVFLFVISFVFNSLGTINSDVKS